MHANMYFQLAGDNSKGKILAEDKTTAENNSYSY